MRLILVLAFILGLAGAGYVALTGFFLARAATQLLTVGTIASAIALATPPTDPLALGYRGTPLQALSLPFQTLTIDTESGPSEAWLVPAAGPEAGRAIYVHGIAGRREDGYRHLSMLHRAGWTVLLISYRNDPEAPTTPENRYAFGLTEWPDLEAAVLRLSGPEAAPLLIVAESMGAAVLGQFLRNSPHADRVNAIALDSPALSFSAVLEHLAQVSGNPFPRPMAWAATLILPGMTGLDLAQAEVGATYAAFRGPLFLAHGSGDRITPIAASETLAAARPATSTVLWTSADHLGSYAEDPAAYDLAFTGFLASLSQ